MHLKIINSLNLKLTRSKFIKLKIIFNLAFNCSISYYPTLEKLHILLIINIKKISVTERS